MTHRVLLDEAISLAQGLEEALKEMTVSDLIEFISERKGPADVSDIFSGNGHYNGRELVIVRGEMPFPHRRDAPARNR